MKINLSIESSIVSSPAFTLMVARWVKDETIILDGVDTKNVEREVTAITGSPVAGKTSPLRLVNRLDDTASGEILYRSSLIKQYRVQELRRKVCFVFQRERRNSLN